MSASRSSARPNATSCFFVVWTESGTFCAAPLFMRLLYNFAIPSSRLYLTIQTLGVTLGFVGNYAPCGLSPQTDGMPVILGGDAVRRHVCLL